MTQIESTRSKRLHLPSLGIKQHLWRANYQSFRFGVIKPWHRILRYDMKAEGTIPDTRPVMLVPVHRTSMDIFAISHVAREFISYVSTDNYGHNRFTNRLQKHLTSSFGSIVWQQNGISNPRARALALARGIGNRLDQRMIIAAFTQGKYQPHSVDTIEDGLVGLIKRYEHRRLIRSGEEIRIPIIPVGLEYDLNGDGLVFSNIARRFADRIPLFPRWSVPAFGTKITVKFGTPQYLDDQSPTELTRDVMRQAAELSNIPYQVA